MQTKSRRLRSRWIIAGVIVLAFLTYHQYMSLHTFTLTDVAEADSLLKKEQIQPIFTSVSVRCNADTGVTFTDMENPEKQFVIGYITQGMTETIRLEHGRWYMVHGGGTLTIRGINIR